MKKIYINYADSGIKTLRITAYLFVILGLMATFLAFTQCFVDDKFVWEGLYGVFLTLIATFFGVGVCFSLALLAENSIKIKEFQKLLLEEKGISVEFEVMPESTTP